MFSREKPIKQSYLDIMETIASNPPALIAPKFATKEAISEFVKETKDISINRLLATHPASDKALAKLENFLSVNGLMPCLLKSLDAIIGSSIQNQEELEIWLTGLATNAFIFGGDVDTVVKHYKTNPYLIMVRFMELVSVDMKG